MDDADADDAAYALPTSVVEQDESINTRQHQHKISSEIAANQLQDKAFNVSLMAHRISKTILDGASSRATNNKEKENDRVNDIDKDQERKVEKDTLSLNEERRCTLSPSKAALFQLQEEALDMAISRRDTVSPEALKALLRTEEDEGEQNREEKKKQKSSLLVIRNNLETSELQHLTEKEKEENEDNVASELTATSASRWKSLSDDVQDAPARSTRSKTTLASKRPRSATKKMCSPNQSMAERRKGTSMVDTSDSLTNLMFAPNLLEQDAVRRTTLDPNEAAAVVTALQKEMRCLSSSTLETEGALNNESYHLEQRKSSKVKASTPSRLNNDKKVSTLSKESNTSPDKYRGKKSPSLSRRKSSSPVKAADGRKSPSPAKKGKGTGLFDQTQSNSMRRTTVEPSDALVVLEDILQLDRKGDRRQTIDENGLFELTNAQESFPAVATDPANELSRKRASDLDASKDVPEKRVRPTNDDRTIESMELDSSLHAGSKLSFQAEDQHKRSSSSNQRYPDELPLSRDPKLSLLSPPRRGPKTRTPLKGILSARKLPQNNATHPVQTTPNKSVNFGPSQGAEFNHGSPSTSMTPMLAKDASRLFPLESPASPEEESDDAETSLNTSILDKADSLDEDEEPMKASVLKVTKLKKPGFDLLQSRRNSFLAQNSTEKSRRRHSMRGYSPLDSQTVARRRRRETINVTRHTSNSVSATATSSTANDSATTASRSPSVKSNNSLFRTTNILETGGMSYVDSSASSEAGEDMEITDDYSHILGRENDATEQQSALSAGQLCDEDTAEFSLGHLLAESSVYELTKSVQDRDHHDLPGSLGDLANEVEASGEGNLAGGAFLRFNDQDATLDPIEEKDETMTSSRGQSMMSLDPDENDEEDTVNLDSLKVNLKSKFDRVSTDAGANSQRPVSSEALSVQLVTMHELLESVALNEQNALVEMNDAFFGEEVYSSDNQISKNVKLACAYDRCSKVVEHCAQDMSTWSKAVSEELSSLLEMKAPAVFSPGNLDDVGREAIQELYATETMVAQTGWCQLQAQVEKQLASTLSVGADMLASDVKSLKDYVSAGALKRRNELAAVKEMIDREEQLALLLDAIEEQQGAHDDYATAVKDLEKECSSLSLEESVLQSRLKVLEGRAAELEPVTSEAALLFEQEVLATEEMLVIQESMSAWKIREATASVLRLSARFEDVLFDVELCVDVHMGSSVTAGTSALIKTNEFLKHKEQSMYLPYESDVVLVLQRLLLDPHYISQIADDSVFGDKNYGHMLSKLQVLEHFINRSFRLLKELRELSTRFSMRYNEEESTLWVDFLKFLSAASHIDVECIQFSVGFSLLPVYPYTDYQTAVQVSHGQVSGDAIASVIELVSRQEPKYFTRVCKQLYESFVR
ncbi:unnamed protein product [Peronospora belbahrii]|uniref:Spc7 kinetochore protein domain-containing protein n=1 Tax=Peronospora belbahrii TaxID=622444 RepID=A0AAU9L054_9STRA|nr:unnamed protein product [Peronospora belbahrii]